MFIRSFTLLCLLAVAACNRPTPIKQPAKPDSTLSGKQRPEGEGTSDVFEQKRQAGIDFVASGSEPFWSLEIDFADAMLFKTVNGDLLRTPVPQPRREEPSGKVVYETDSLTVAIQMKACQNSMSGAESESTVEVMANGKTYNGCGRFLFNATALHDIWAVEELNGKQLNPASFRRGVPLLELYPLEQRVTGNTGCNSLNGRVETGSDHIRFSGMAVTKMACQETGNVETNFLAALAKANAYQVENGKLTLLQDGKKLMQLKKVD